MKRATSNTQKQVKRRSKPYPIVAVGASAGGLEAIRELLENLPSDTGMAYVYIQHLDPTHESMLSTILARSTKMKTVEAEHMIPIEPNQLYIIPPNKNMEIVDGVLTLNEREVNPHIHMPIDQFFVSLAEKQKEGAIGIILSGNANDGTLGLRAIKSAGGLTFAQDDSAKFKSMPKSAIAEGAVDLILSPKEIAQELSRLSKQTDVIQAVMRDAAPEEDISNKDEDLTSILQILKKSVGVDFAHYKMNTIKRRIIRRMLLFQLSSLKEYLQYLKQHVNEVNLLYQDLLINVTSFFRDADTMNYLKTNLFPEILKLKSANNPLRVWVPACSTGEEGYSIAMILTELIQENSAGVPIQISGTDLSERVIIKARTGIYSALELKDVSEQRLKQFFTIIDGSYRISKIIRDMCVFAPHNIFKDPPFSRMDFISCCNLMIYLDSVLQRKALDTFHYALRPAGFLMLGKSETIGHSEQLFKQIDKQFKLYGRKKDPGATALFDMSYRVQNHEKSTTATNNKPVEKQLSNAPDLEQMVNSILLSKYIPASVLVNHDLEILHFKGSTGLFLEPVPGKASLNILKMVRSGLAFELRNAIHKAEKTLQTIKKTDIKVVRDGSMQSISIEVVPLEQQNEEKLFLIVFEDVTSVSSDSIKPALSKDKLLKQLQNELSSMEEDMRSIVKEQEASNEELQSANEEITSSNEELQSINEEMETSKEELESSNEELMTINNELEVRNDQLSESYEYSEAIIGIIRESVLILDNSLRIRSVNKYFYETFKVSEKETIGILIYELGNGQWNIPGLRHLLEEIIPYNSEVNGFKVSHNFPGIGEKTMLLNAKKSKIHGQQLVLIDIQDITEHEQVKKLHAVGEERFRNMANSAPVLICTTDTNKKSTFLNETWLNYTGKNLEQEVEDGWIDSIYKEDRDDFLHVYNSCFNDRKNFRHEFRLLHKSGEYRWILSLGTPNYEPDGTFIGFIITCTDISKEVEARKIIEESEERFRQMADTMPHMVWTATAEGELNYFNQRFYDYTGQSRNEAISEASFKYLHPDDAERGYQLWNQYLKSGNPMEGEVRFRKTDGEYRWHLVRGMPLKNENNSLKLWVGTCTDIHDQKMIHDELERRVFERTHELQEINKEIERSNSELQQFAYVASHDLQEPLRKIITFADRLQQFKNVLPDNGKIYIEKIASSSERMTKLIDDLLNFSRVSRSGNIFLNTDLRQTLKKVLSDFELIVTQKNAEITYQNLPVIEAIPVQMEQLFNNLISNALKFAKEGTPPIITIKGRKVTEGEDEKLNGLDRSLSYVEIVVRDNGIGFSNEFAEQIFIIFQRLNERQRYPGTGIGLSICRRIVNNHNGKITAVSNESEGTAFYIILPIKHT